MKLSEAMLAGAKKRPKCFGSFFGLLEVHGADFGSCALGAAYEGSRFYGSDGKFTTIDEASYMSGARTLELWPVLNEEGEAFACPACGARRCTLNGMIVHMNDSLEHPDHRSADSREKTAAWLASKGL